MQMWLTGAFRGPRLHIVGRKKTCTQHMTLFGMFVHSEIHIFQIWWFIFAVYLKMKFLTAWNIWRRVVIANHARSKYICHGKESSSSKVVSVQKQRLSRSVEKWVGDRGIPRVFFPLILDICLLFCKCSLYAIVELVFKPSICVFYILCISINR